MRNAESDEFIAEKDLYQFLGNLIEYVSALDKLERNGRKPALIELLIRQGVEDQEFLRDEEKMKSIADTLAEMGFNAKQPECERGPEGF